jgi:hypothetical protein
MSRSRRWTAAWTRRAAVSSPVRCPAKLSRRRDASDRSTALRHLRLTPPALTAQKQSELIQPRQQSRSKWTGRALRTWTGRGRRARGRGRARGGRRAAARCPTPPRPHRRGAASPPSPSSLACFFLWEKLREAGGARVLVPRRAPSRHPDTHVRPTRPARWGVWLRG